MNNKNDKLGSKKYISDMLDRSLLTSDQVSLELLRYGHQRLDDEQNYVDDELLSAFKEVWSLSSEFERFIPELQKSKDDAGCTKRFYSYKATMDNWKHFNDPTSERRDSSWMINYQVASHLVKKSCHIRQLDPVRICIENRDQLVSNKTASVGAIGKGTKAENLELCINTANLIVDKIKSGEEFGNIWIPFSAFHRAQISNLVNPDGTYNPNHKRKDRLILGIDGGSFFVEARYARPLINHLSSAWFSYSGGDKPQELRAKIRQCRSKQYWTSLDYSKFDQTVQSWVIRTCFEIIKEFFDPKEHKIIDWICYNFIHSWLIYPGGIGQKHRGIPSGSYFTQVVGSMANMLMMLTYLSSTARPGANFEERVQHVQQLLCNAESCTPNQGNLTMFVLGDDNLFFTNDKIDFKSLSSYVKRVFGVDVNPEKVAFGDCNTDPEYLKRQWRYKGEYRDPLALAINCTHPEHYRDYNLYSAWHIMYGLYLTYPLAFPPHCTEMYFVVKMHESKGVEAMRELRPRELPGVLRAFGDQGVFELYLRAKSFAKEAGLL